jgi:hypothetical protein
MEHLVGTGRLLTAFEMRQRDAASHLEPGFSADTGDDSPKTKKGSHFRRKLRTAVRQGNIVELQHLLQVNLLSRPY